MALPDLKPYKYGRKVGNVVGTVLLADATTPVVAVDSTASQVVLGPFDASGLTAYGCQTDFPLMLKLFCSDVVPDSTGEFKVTVSGLLGSTALQRRDNESFGVSWNIRDWASLADADATVTISMYLPMTSVSMNCVCGIATDYIDRKNEGSYA